MEGRAAESLQKSWYQASFDELSAFAETVPQPHWLEGDLPQWVANAGLEIAKTFLPLANLQAGMEMTPGRLGAVFGHQIAAANEFATTFEVVTREHKGAAGMLRPTGGFGEGYPEQLLNYFEQFGNAIKGACASAIDGEYAECVEFFAGLSEAMKRQPSNMERTNTRILLALLVGWRAFEQLPSIRVVHDVFCKAMNPQLVGNLKRFEKLCQRIEFNVRGRGRPRKADRTHKFRRGKG